MLVGFGTTTVVVPTGNGLVLCHAIMPAPPPIGGYVLTSGTLSAVHPAGGVSAGSGPTVPSLKTKMIPKQFGTVVVRVAVMLVVEKIGAVGVPPTPESNVAFTELPVGESAYANAL